MTRSMENAMEQSRMLQTPQYIVQGKDEAVYVEEAENLTAPVQADLPKRVNTELTKSLPSFLPLYRGMRLIPSTKDCVRLGVMKACPFILENVMIADDEVLPSDAVAGEPCHLRCMPVSLILRAENAPLILPAADPPLQIPTGVDSRGLFQFVPVMIIFAFLVKTVTFPFGVHPSC